MVTVDELSGSPIFKMKRLGDEKNCSLIESFEEGRGF
jgi:hypothetical protein